MESYNACQSIWDSPNSRAPSEPKRSWSVKFSRNMFQDLSEWQTLDNFLANLFWLSRLPNCGLANFLHDCRAKVVGWWKMKRWIEAFPAPRLSRLSGSTHSRQPVHWFLVNNKNHCERRSSRGSINSPRVETRPGVSACSQRLNLVSTRTKTQYSAYWSETLAIPLFCQGLIHGCYAFGTEVTHIDA